MQWDATTDTLAPLPPRLHAMSDILAAFEREQAEEQEREHRLFRAMQEGTADTSTNSSTDEPASNRAAAAARPATAGRHTHRAVSANSQRGSSTSGAAVAAASSASAIAAASPSLATAVADADADADDVASRFDSDFALRPLLWSSLAANVPPAAHVELRRLIGVSEIERNEELQKEVEALLSIASATQLTNAREKAKQAAAVAEPTAAVRDNSSGSSSSSSLFSRAALPDSATRAFLAEEVQSLLLSLRAHALRSGILQPDEGEPLSQPSSRGSSAGGNGNQSGRGSSAGGNGIQSGPGGSSNSSSGLAKILPRPVTARQKRVLDQMVAQALTSTSAHTSTHTAALRRDTHSAGHMTPSQSAGHSVSSSMQSQASDAAASAPSSRPASGARAPLTARSSSARQRSMSSLSSGGSTPPPANAAGAAGAAMSDQTAAAAAVLSHSLLSPSTGGDSARSSLVRSLRSALEEERKALLQDVEYLHACLELEMDETIEVEKQRQQQQQQQQQRRQTKDARTSITGATASSSSPAAETPLDDLPPSVSELRALEKALKVALVAEEVRSHTLALMSDVEAAHYAEPFAAKSNAVQPLGTGIAASAATGMGTPLKAVRMPSAGRVRPATTSSASAAGLPNGSPLQHQQQLPASTTRSPSPPVSAAPATSNASPAAGSGPLDLAELMELNADLFSAGPVEPATAIQQASSSSASYSSQRPRPAIPMLALGALGGSGAASSSSSGVLLDHFPAGPGTASPPLSPSDRESPVGAAAAVVSTPVRRAKVVSGTVSSAAESKESLSAASSHASVLSPCSSPLTSRSASKARSRIQAAQNFQDKPTVH